MARSIRLPRDPWVRPGTKLDRTAGEWLVEEMTAREICNTDLFASMRKLGFSATSVNIVTMWRSGSLAISLRTLPLILEALGMHAEEQRLWARHFASAELPDLWPLLEEAT